MADNLRVQWSALQSIQKKWIDSQEPAFLIFPCACHNLSLAIKDSIEDCQVLNEAANSIIQFSRALNRKKSKSILRKSCPVYCETRWNVIYDISKWIVDNFWELDSFFHDPIILDIDSIADDLEILTKTLYIQAPLIILMFSPFKTLSKLFEVDSCAMSQIFPFTLSAIAKGRAITSFSEFTTTIYEIIKTHVHRRLLNTERSPLLYFLFLCTPQGRKFEMNCVRGRDTLDILTAEEFCDSVFPINVDQEIIERAKLMLNPQSMFQQKYHALQELHSNQDLFKNILNENEEQIRNERQNTLNYLIQQDKECSASETDTDLSKKWRNIVIEKYEKELSENIRFSIHNNIPINPKIINDNLNGEIEGNQPLATLTNNVTFLPLKGKDDLFTSTNDFIIQNDEDLSDKQNALQELYPMFMNEEEWGKPHRFDPTFWRQKKHKLNLMKTTDTNDEEEECFDDIEKIKTYFSDFDEEYVNEEFDFTFSESKIRETLKNVAKVYKLDHVQCTKFLVSKWRQSSWDETFLDIDESTNGNTKDFWTYVESNAIGDSSQKEFANLALRICSIASSEAAVERVFSKLRNVTTGSFSNTSVQLAEARLIIKWNYNVIKNEKH